MPSERLKHCSLPTRPLKVPAGRTTIAPRFIVGSRPQKAKSPVGATERAAWRISAAESVRAKLSPFRMARDVQANQSSLTIDTFKLF